jgi:hypothetical protein
MISYKKYPTTTHSRLSDEDGGWREGRGETSPARLLGLSDQKQGKSNTYTLFLVGSKSLLGIRISATT